MYSKMRTYHLVVLILIKLTALSATTNNIVDSSYNLPMNTIPIRYILTMEPIFGTSPWFNGSVVIEIKALEATSNITLHMRHLDITESLIKITGSNNIEINCINTTYDDDREFYTIHLEKQLIKDEYYNLTIGEFTGKLKSHENLGFYLAKYKTENGQERELAVTDFEPSDARQAFPCFDEPATKATFIIKLIRNKSYNSLSNQELSYTEDLGNGKYMDIFKETVNMSTYLVAFMVSDFGCTEQKERHRVYAMKSAVQEGKLDYALSMGVEILQALENYTGINYTLNKIDQVAIPDKYFTDEAMENWGMVTFSEKHLFISNGVSTMEDTQKCTCYIAHEFSHQWFGNLVTFKEWKYIWLSEGFASFFQYYIVSLIKPDWRLMDQFVLQFIHRVIEYDTSLDTQPLNYQPKSIGDIPSPWICYYKASAIIRMIQHFLTESVFQKGLQIYLNRHMFGAVEPLDLYNALQEAVDEAGVNEQLGNNSVASILKTWDTQMGYPLITAIRNYDDGSVTISQGRYFSESVLGNDNIWYVPISYVVQSDQNWNFSNTVPNFWLTSKNITLNEKLSSDSFLLINKQQSGLYRVNYDTTNWERIANFLDSDEYDSVHYLNRAQLLDDAFHFAVNGQIPFTVLLNLTKYLIREKDYAPLTAFDQIILYLDKMMTSSPLYNMFEDYAINLLNTAYDHIGFDEKDTDLHLDKFNRKLLLKWLCKFGHSGCRNNAIKKLRDWETTGNFDVSPNLKLTVMCGAIGAASLEEWEFLYSKLNGDPKNDEVILNSLSCSENKAILRKYLDIINNSTTISMYQTRVILLKIYNTGPVGLNTAFEYLKEKKNDLRKDVLMSFQYDIGDSLTTEDQLAQIKALGLEQFRFSIKRAQENLNWINRGQLKDIENWLTEYNSNNIEESNLIQN